MLFLLSTAAGLAVDDVRGYSCPSSSAWIHASAHVTALVQASCADVRAEMQARISGQPTAWHDPHNNGTYAVLDATGADTLKLRRTTHNGQYTDKINFVFEQASA